MTIDEMKQLKTDTENQISELLMGFHKKTGLFISDPGVRIETLSSCGKKERMAVIVDIQISM